MSVVLAAAGTDDVATDAAIEALGAGGGAVDALVAGFFAAAGADPSVLLAPAVALVVGLGAGARAFDGRSVQPGREVPRPRGFLSGASIPDVARAGVPRALTMIAYLHGTRGRSSLTELIQPGVVAAQAAGSKPRAELLRNISRMGVLALRSGAVGRELLAALGPMGGGTLSHADLATPADETDASATTLDDGSVALAPPWSGRGEGGRSRVLLAADRRGVLAALAYTPSDRRIPIEAIDLEASLGASPVLRGVQREAPGTVIATAAPIAALRSGARMTMLGLGGALRVDEPELSAFTGTTPAHLALATVRRGYPSARCVIWDGEAPRVVGVSVEAGA